MKEWQNKKEKIENMKYKRNTFKVKSGKVFSRYPDMEKELKKWIIDKRSKGGCECGFAIKQQASEIYRNVYGSNFGNFQSSNGWIIKFLKRKNIVLRRITTTGRDLPPNTQTIINDFFATCQSLISEGFEHG